MKEDPVKYEAQLAKWKAKNDAIKEKKRKEKERKAAKKAMSQNPDSPVTPHQGKAYGKQLKKCKYMI